MDLEKLLDAYAKCFAVEDVAGSADAKAVLLAHVAALTKERDDAKRGENTFRMMWKEEKAARDELESESVTLESELARAREAILCVLQTTGHHLEKDVEDRLISALTPGGNDDGRK